MRKLILQIVFICLSATSFSQSVDIFINGAATVDEGNGYVYSVSYRPNVSGPFNFTSQVTNGTVVAQDLNPLSSEMYVRIVWNCQVTSGNLKITETNTSSIANYPVVVNNFSNIFRFCQTISPATQNINISQLQIPQYLTITNCASNCASFYGYTYQWQEADISIGGPLNAIYSNITGATSETFQPPTLSVRKFMYYRRITSFWYNGQFYSYTSRPAAVNYSGVLNPGSITGYEYVDPNTVPVISQIPASDGFCNPTVYNYSWERSIDNGSWIEISQGVDFTSTDPLTLKTKFRRKVSCGFETAYSNELEINIATPLYPGELFQSVPNVFPYGTIPTVYQDPASGGPCSTHSYTWERSINNGPWHSIGNTVNYPSGVGIVGNSRFRRKVTCGYLEMYTNIVSYVMSPYTSPNSENLNYVRVNSIMIPYVGSWEEADNLTTGKKVQQTSYFDGLQRQIQNVVKQGAFMPSLPPFNDPQNINNYQDLVQIYEHDALGRKPKNYMPFVSSNNPGKFKSNALSEQQSFINSKYSEPTNSTYTSTTSIYDNSPLNQVINKKSTGSQLNANQDYKGISSEYGLYKQTEKVKIWDIGYTQGSIPVNSGVYPDHMLLKTISKDEKDKMIIQYLDFAGKVILKKVQEKDLGAGLDLNGHTGWLSTYYVYDDFGRERYVITPKAVDEMFANAGGNDGQWIITNTIRNGLCFYQEFDKKGRVIIKHVPDGGESWFVYDNRDRVVFAQDEKQRNRPSEIPSKPAQWAFSLYDDLNRVIATGLIDDSRNRVNLQAMVSGIINPQNKLVELFVGTWKTVKAHNPVAGKIPGAGFYCGTCTESITNSLSFYDVYGDESIAFQPINENNFAPGTTNYNGYIVDPAVKSIRTKNIVTTVISRVIDDKHDNGNTNDDQFLTSSSYINEKGQTIQSLNQNIKSGIDKESFRYDFTGNVVSSFQQHNATNSIYSGLISVSKTEFDLLGRQIKLSRLFTMNASDVGNAGLYQKLNEISYDEFGRVRTKKIGSDPINSSLPMETQDFTYNIQGLMTGINKDYAQAGSAGGAGSQWYRRFGMSFGFEDASSYGSNFIAQFNGNIAGVIWRSQGDNYQRKYNFAYDNIGRFTNAIFTQRETVSGSSPWVNTKVNLSSSVSGYDANGNILGLQHTGIIPGTDGGTVIDNLQYSYYSSSNQLKSVNDIAFLGNPSANGKQGDFKNYTPSDGIDYIYDKNGNLEVDKNKAIIDNASTLNAPVRGIIYNYLYLPQQIVIKDKVKIDYIYDANGAKLGKKVTQLVAGAPPAKTTWFIGGIIYEENDIQYILHEEGRFRIMEPVAAYSLPSNSVNYLDVRGKVQLVDNGTIRKWGVWDYFIKDHLSNTRLVLTDEYHRQVLKCTMEDNPTPLKDEEELTFGKTGGGNEVSLTRFGKLASGWPTTAGDPSKVSRLINQPGAGGFTQAIGPNALLKVMAGDEIAGTVEYHYQNISASSNNVNILQTIVSGFINTITGGSTASGIIKDNSTAISVVNSGAGSPINQFLNNQPPPTQSSTPRAYLNIIFFDEQFRYVGESSNAIMVEETTPGTPKTGSRTLSQQATKNGYVYVYVSNESTNIPVYFDNFMVSHIRGPIVEDNAYYPYGLKIHGISAKAALKPNLKEGFQGSFSEFDTETGYNEFLLRHFDPQIGRWVQLDPSIVEAGMYNGMGGNPFGNIDPDGADWFKNLATGLLEFLAYGPEACLPGYEWKFKEGRLENGEWGDAFGQRWKELVNVSVFGKMPKKIEETLRQWTNTGLIDEKIGLLWGLGRSLVNTVKGAVILYSMGNPITSSSTYLQQQEMLKGIDMLQKRSMFYGGHVEYVLAEDFLSNAYKTFTTGDKWDQVTWMGETTGDVGQMFLGPETIALKGGKIGLGVLKSETGVAGKLVGFGSDAAIIENSASLIPKKGWYDVVIHGTEDGLEFTMNGTRLSPQQLYDNMLASGYQQGTRIRLMSCYSGSLPNGAASQLSKLAQAPVMAPGSWMSISNGAGFLPKGKFIVGDGMWFKIFK